ncbi:endopolyphosphatase [Panus rudis PR-1116 ss-1]|nr:endopolyphosphatase [Panus rudis PR-1116 ss-1]
MLKYTLVLLLVLSSFRDALSAPAQVPLDMSVVATARPKRKLQGRFLHITDMHPDPYYRVGMSEKSACHRKKPKKAKPRSGPYGIPYSECDSPFSLTNYTLDYIEKKWSDDIDFVIWTGDSARHDNDRKLPRTTREIYELNRAMARRMEEVFLSKGIPVVPTIGNNDIWPHNIMLPGPNDITSQYSSIWRSFIPFTAYQVFQRGGYFSVDVIPDSVAAISLNTLYFYASNKAVGGCVANDSEDPGNLQLDWLEVQLQTFRRRGMQVWLVGHVPPSARNYYPDCHVRYVELSLRYQDTILGHLYGHMNVDHFFFLDAQAIEQSGKDRSSDGPLAIEAEDGLMKKKHKDLYGTLLKDFNHVRKESNLNHAHYAVVNVAPSVVPNPYLPSFRIFSYNISGSPYVPGDLGDSGGQSIASRDEASADCLDDDDSGGSCEKWTKDAKDSWYSSPDSPSRKNGLWTPLGYAQYYIPNLNGTGKRPPKFKLEYLTFAPTSLHPPATGARGWYPIPLKNLPRSLRNATVTRSKYAPYRMADLTIPSWVKLAQRLAKPRQTKLRGRFRRYMYMGADDER